MIEKRVMVRVMTFASAAGWIALGFLPLTAALGLVQRRFAKGSLLKRMRPHFLAGYAALAFAGVHVMLSTGAMAAANGSGIWVATFAIAGLGAQSFTGASLQDPGGYRTPLRRWHLWLFWSVSTLSIAHVLLDA